MTRLIDADALKVDWYAEKTNRDEPIWEFKCFGHHGEVVYGGDKTLWSAKLDNSGRYDYINADEAKSAVEKWLREKIARNIETAKEYSAQYAALITNATGAAKREGRNIERLEEMRQQYVMNPELHATKQAYINALEYELKIALSAAPKE